VLTLTLLILSACASTIYFHLRTAKQFDSFTRRGHFATSVAGIVFITLASANLYEGCYICGDRVGPCTLNVHSPGEYLLAAASISMLAIHLILNIRSVCLVLGR
jgi:hypothetical protein